jgi:hypothetical protein
MCRSENGYYKNSAVMNHIETDNTPLMSTDCSNNDVYYLLVRARYLQTVY